MQPLSSARKPSNRTATLPYLNKQFDAEKAWRLRADPIKLRFALFRAAKPSS